jgi:hypothetical protein
VIKVDKTFLVGALLLLGGIVWAVTTGRVGTTEWLLLLVGAGLGIAAGMVQGWAIARKKEGKAGSGKRILYVAGTLIVFVALKVALNIAFPSYLATSLIGTWLSIVIAVGGLFIGRAAYAQPVKSRIPTIGH